MTLVIFGITGDLSQRFLLPALNQICQAGLTKNLKILGVSRRPLDPEEVLGTNQDALKSITKFFQMDLDQTPDYQRLKNELSQQPNSQVIFYLAVPPEAVLPIINHLGQAGLNTPNTKLLLEKPFGFDLVSARQLISQTNKCFSEEQVYRIDHYLAKEMVQNIVVFLGSNALFRDVWNNQFIEKIDIVATESIGIEGRAKFYESTGALRDIIQSHLLQLAALTLMEPCSGVFEFEELPQRRLAALQALAVKTGDNPIRAQYEGYRQEVSNPSSATETFARLTLVSSDPRWSSVPIHLATGKNLDQKLTEIKVYFKKKDASEANLLKLRVQPNEGIELELWIKEPGLERRLQKKSLSFTYEQHYDRLPDAYERVLVDAMRGSHSLFASSEEVIESWRILEPVQQKWRQDSGDLFTYKPGSTSEEVLSKNT